MKPDVLDEMIEEREARRAELQSHLSALSAEINVLKEAKARQGGVKPTRKVDTSRNQAAEDAPTRSRALKPMWADVMREIGRRGSASIDGLDAYNKKQGHDIKRGTLRSQLSIYANRGWLERTDDGEYRLTESGAEKCDFVVNGATDDGYTENSDQTDEAPTDAGASSSQQLNELLR